jgi:SAM-dependent methyltransferase
MTASAAQTGLHTVWHYDGIVAAAYDHYFGVEPYWDQRFYAERLHAVGGRALELACGTGRLLLPMLRDGLEVEGLDTSADMLAILHAKAQRLKLDPRTYRLPMQAFDLPRRYRSVFVPAGTFGILVHDAEIDATLACCLHALEPGGQLLVPLATEPPTPTPVGAWQPRRDVAVPGHAARVRIEEQWHATADPDIGRWVLRYEVTFADDRPPETFERTHLLRRHDPRHFARRLAAAGFTRITSNRGYAEMPSDDPGDDLIFVAQRPD